MTKVGSYRLFRLEAGSVFTVEKLNECVRLLESAQPCRTITKEEAMRRWPREWQDIGILQQALGVEALPLALVENLQQSNFVDAFDRATAKEPRTCTICHTEVRDGRCRCIIG